eukprot:jgi/Botrbrau1/16776/Bobra.150_2s0011.1
MLRGFNGALGFRNMEISGTTRQTPSSSVIRRDAQRFVFKATIQASSQGAVVVTGASSGIGFAICKELQSLGFQVYGNVINEKEAEDLQKATNKSIQPLIFDVRDAATVKEAANLVRRDLAGQTLRGLINNAGVMQFGPLLYQPVSEFQQHLDVNVVGVFNVMQAFVPLLGADRTLQGSPGRVVQNSSICGTTSVPFLGAYSASKQAMEGLSQAWRRELLPFGIDVVIVAPGAVKTRIWENALSVSGQYMSCEYRPALEKWVANIKESGENGASPEETAKVFVEALTAKNPRVFTSVSGGPPLPLWALKLLPQRLIDQGMARSFGLNRDMLKAAPTPAESSLQSSYVSDAIAK